MITRELLAEIGVKEEDIGPILEQNEIYGEKISPLAEEYLKTVGHKPFLACDSHEERSEAWQRAGRYMKDVSAIDEDKKYMLQLLAWLNLLPHQKKRYKELGISHEVFVATAKNIVYKIEECKTVYGCIGIFTEYFFVDFDLKLFALGRLQFEAFRYCGKSYTYKSTEIKDGDTVYFCHIPSSGKLTPELCMDSLQKAYEFFKDRLPGSVIPVYCESWLLYGPYIENVFPEGSNLRKFTQLFDLYSNTEEDSFSPCWRIFGKMFNGTTEDLPSDTTLRRNFIDYINRGGTFGNGSGIILYDGEKREIINRR